MTSRRLSTRSAVGTKRGPVFRRSRRTRETKRMAGSISVSSTNSSNDLGQSRNPGDPRRVHSSGVGVLGRRRSGVAEDRRASPRSGAADSTDSSLLPGHRHAWPLCCYLRLREERTVGSRRPKGRSPAALSGKTSDRQEEAHRRPRSTDRGRGDQGLVRPRKSRCGNDRSLPRARPGPRSPLRHRGGSCG